MSSDAPVALRVRAARRVLEIDWADGSTAVLAHALLREACRCALCESARRRGQAAPVRADVAIAAIEPYGPNVLHIRFDDGHDRGLYPFSMLRELAPDGRRSAPENGATGAFERSLQSAG